MSYVTTDVTDLLPSGSSAQWVRLISGNQYYISRNQSDDIGTFVIHKVPNGTYVLGRSISPNGPWITEDAAYVVASNPTSSASVAKYLTDYNPKADAKQVTNGAITTGSAILTSATAAFTAADVGKIISVAGAGPTVAAAGMPLQTTILSWQSATQVTLAANASNTVSGATVTYGSDDTAAILAWLTAAVGGVAIGLWNKSLFFSNITLTANNYVLDGAGMTLWSTYANDNVTNALRLVGSDLTVRNLKLRALSPITPSQRAAGGNANNGDLLRIGGTLVPGTVWNSRVQVQNCYVTGAYGQGVNLYLANQSGCTNCVLDSNNGGSVAAVSCQNDVVIANNWSTNTGDDSIAVLTDANVPAGTVRVVISGNTVNGADATGIKTSGVQGCSIVGNAINMTYTAAIQCFTDTFYSLGPSSHIEIVGNHINNAGQRYGGSYLHGTISSLPNGIEITVQTTHVAIEGNTILNSAGRGINIATPSYETTTVGATTLPQASIQVTTTGGSPAAPPNSTSWGPMTIIDAVTGAESQFNYTSVDATHFLGCTGGAGTFAGGSIVIVPVVDITIGSNVIRVAAQYGIQCGNPDLNDNNHILGVTITGNAIWQTVGGIAIGSVTGFTCTGNSIRGYGSAAGNRGIQIGYARLGTVSGNLIFNNTGGGGGGAAIFLYNTQTHVRVHGNVAKTTPANLWTPPPAFTTPAFPGTGTRVVNQTGMDVTIYITAGTNAVSQVLICGQDGSGQTVLPNVTAGAGGGVSPPIRLPAGCDIQLTYTAGGAPAWLWMAD